MTLLNNPSQAEPARGRLSTWVTHTSTSPTLGTFRPGTYFVRAHCHVTEAFDSDGSDNLTVGYTTDTDAFVTSIDVSTTGVKSVSLGTLAGYNGTAHSVTAYYVAGGSAPTQGKCLIVLEFIRVPTQP